MCCSFNFNCIVGGVDSKTEFKVKATERLNSFFIC